MPLNLEEIVPRERSGSSTQARFHYQKEFTLSQCINMLANPEIVKVYSDFHSDCVVKDNAGFHTFYQVKGITSKLLSESFFKREAIDDMFYNFSLADGDCRSVLATNADVDSELKKILEIKENLHKNIATNEEKQHLEAVKTEWQQAITGSKSLFDKFVEEFEIQHNLPSFSETSIEGEMTLKAYNIKWLKEVLDKTLNNSFSIEDATLIHDMIFKHIESRTVLTTRSNRFITTEQLLDKIAVPPFQRIYFTHKFTPEEIDRIKDQTILEGKLEQGGFSPYFIKNAKLVRCVTLFSREKLSKINAVGNLIDDFEYSLTSICLDVFEDHVRRDVFNSLEMLKDLQAQLMVLASDPKYKMLNLDHNFIKGLIWEATSQCKFRWNNDGTE